MSEEKSNDIINLKFYFELLKKHILIIGFCAIVGLLCAYVLYFFTEKKYSASSSLLIEKTSDGLELDDLFSSSLYGRNSNEVANETFILGAKPLIREVIEKLALHLTYYKLENFKYQEIYGSTSFEVQPDSTAKQLLQAYFRLEVIDSTQFRLSIEEDSYLFGGISDLPTIQEIKEVATYEQIHSFGELVQTEFFSFHIQNNRPLLSGEEYFFKISDLSSLTLDFKSRLSIQPIAKEASILNLSLQDTQPMRGLDFLQYLMETYIQQDLLSKQAKYSATLAFIDKSIVGVVRSLNQAALELERFQIQNKTINLDYTTKSLYDEYAKLEEERSLARIKRNYLDYLNTYLEQKSNDQVIIPTMIDDKDSYLNDLVAELSEVNSQLSIAFDQVDAANPVLDQLIKKNEYLKRSLKKNVETLITEVDLEMKDLSENIGLIEEEIAKLPITQRTYIGIEREFQLNNEIYTYLLQKRSETSILQASVLPNKKIIEPASLDSTQAVSPNLIRMLAIGLILGSILPLGLILLIEKSRSKISTYEDIVALMPESIFLGIVPHSKQKDFEGNLIRPRSMVGEAFRAIKVNLNALLKKGADQKIVGVTSYLAGEGKSFVSTGLSRILALNEKKVLYINADMRKASSIASPDATHGMSTLLSGVITLEEFHLTGQHFDYIPNGPIPPNPHELLESELFPQILNQLKENYDYIIIDFPPAGLIADWQLVNLHLEQTIYVIREGYTPKASLDFLKSLQISKASNIALLFNDVKEKRFSQNYYRGYY